MDIIFKKGQMSLTKKNRGMCPHQHAKQKSYNSREEVGKTSLT
jgi:ribosome modulation factor